MVNQKEITCIVCPIGCKILVNKEGEKVDILQGSKCKRGTEYAINETLDPRRVLTTSVFVKDGDWPLVSVKSTHPIPKDKLFTVLDEIKKTTVKAPVKSGQIIIKNVAGTNIDIISTKTVI